MTLPIAARLSARRGATYLLPLLTSLFLVALLARPSVAAKQALLVGVDGYPFLPQAEQMLGVRRDVERMNLLLKYCNFTVTQVVGEKAGATGIREAMAALIFAANPGDEVVFYFSGRGSVRYDPKEPNQKTDLEPTLVPYDGKADEASGDILMSEIETFAKALEAKKANPVILIDACFVRRATRSEDRFYRDIPRSIPRPGTARAMLYGGPGVFLSAAGPSGQAYEWRVDFNTNTWRGAFTDFWTNAAMRRLKNNEAPTYAQVTDDVRRYFSLKKGYMVGFVPYPMAESANGRAEYQRPIFGMAKGVPPAAGEPKVQVTAAVDQQTKRAGSLRVGIARWQEEIPQAEFDQVSADLGKLLGAQLKNVSIVPTYGDRPDRIVFLSKDEGRLMARVVGTEVDAYRKPEYRADDPKGLLSEGLADYLQRQALALALFSKTDPAVAKPTLTGVTLIAKSTKTTYRRGDQFAYSLEIPADGLLYIVDSNDTDGAVSLVWPVGVEWDNTVKKGKLSVPRKARYVLPEDMIVPTRTVTRAILIVPAKGVRLPSMAPPEGDAWAGDTPEYSAAERAHLAALLDLLEKGQVRWTAITFDYQVTP